MLIKFLLFLIISLLTITVIFTLIFISLNKKRTLKLINTLKHQTKTTTHKVVDYSLIKDLPRPVQRYFNNILSKDRAIIQIAKFKQVGELKVNPKAKEYSPFKASQTVSIPSASFVWDAKIDTSPIVHVNVIDTFINGVAASKVLLFSALKVAKDGNKDELNSAALYRYLAEAPFYPTALLPSSGVTWKPVDNNKALATLTKNGITISLEFRFSSKGEIIGVYTKERFGKFGEDYIQYPWEGKYSDYKTFNGVKIPTKCEVGWHLPSGWWLFLKAKIVDTEFES